MVHELAFVGANAVLKTAIRVILLGLCIVLISGCVGAKKSLRFDPFSGETRAQWPVWPSPPEVPRFIYAGQLTGEANFLDDSGESASQVANALAWLVGIGQVKKVPVVLQRPQSGMVDAAGRIYVTDVSRRAVFVFDNVAGQLKVWGLAEAGINFKAPIGVVAGTDGNILVTDAELGLVAVIGPDGTPRRSFGAGILKRPTGIARDPERGRIYVADTRGNDIKVFDDQGMLLDRIGQAGDGAGALNSPTHIAFSGNHLYVTDTLNARVQVFTPEGDFVRSFGRRGVYLGNLSLPKGVTVDSAGNVYLIESYFDHLLIFDKKGQFLLPIGGTGHGIGEFYLPAGIWMDDKERIYVADMFNGRVVIFQSLGETQ